MNKNLKIIGFLLFCLFGYFYLLQIKDNGTTIISETFINEYGYEGKMHIVVKDGKLMSEAFDYNNNGKIDECFVYEKWCKGE